MTDNANKLAFGDAEVEIFDDHRSAMIIAVVVLAELGELERGNHQWTPAFSSLKSRRPGRALCRIRVLPPVASRRNISRRAV